MIEHGVSSFAKLVIREIIGFKFRYIIFSLLALSLAGCNTLWSSGSLYFHNESNEERTAAALTAFEATRTNHMAMFDEQREFLTESSAQNQSLVFDSEINQRDAFLVTYIDELTVGKSVVAAKNKISGEVSNRIEQLVGKNLDTNTLNDLIRKRYLMLENSITAETNRITYRAALIEFQKDSGAKVSKSKCDLKNTPELQGGDHSIKSVVETRCDALRARLGNIEKLAFQDFTDNSILGQIESQSKSLEELVSTQRSIITALSAEVKTANDALRGASDDPLKVEKAKQRLMDIACLFVKIGDVGSPEGENDTAADEDQTAECQNRDLEEAAMVVFLQSSTSKGDDAKKADADKDAKVMSGQTNRLIELIGDLETVGMSVRGLVEAEFELAQSNAAISTLSTIISELSESEMQSSPGTNATRIIRGSIEAVGLIDNFTRSGNELGVSALTIATQAKDFQAQLAQREATRLNEELRLSTLKRQAVRNELLHLASAKIAADKAVVEQDLVPALRNFQQSWNNGRVQQRMINYLRFENARSAWLSRERIGTQARYDAIRPALSELANFGAGGIDPGLIAQYLQLLGVTAIAVGTN